MAKRKFGNKRKVKKTAEPWVCKECKSGVEDECSRPEYCNATRERRNEAADIMRKEMQERQGE